MTQTPSAGTGQGDSLSSRVATRVRMLMAAKRRSNRELAELLHMSERNALRKKNGEQEFTLREIEKLAEWLGVEPGALFTGLGIEVVAVAS